MGCKGREVHFAGDFTAVCKGPHFFGAVPGKGAKWKCLQPLCPDVPQGARITAQVSKELGLHPAAAATEALPSICDKEKVRILSRNVLQPMRSPSQHRWEHFLLRLSQKTKRFRQLRENNVVLKGNHATQTSEVFLFFFHFPELEETLWFTHKIIRKLNIIGAQ